MAESKPQLKARARRIGKILAAAYPKARISLDFETPWQCLVATILSAQCTDARVNRVTPVLFSELPTPAAMAAADPGHVQKLIVTTGFFRQKTKSLMGAARAIVERYGGKVPDTMENLVTLPGVGRKTANVLLGHVYGKPGFVVDTHVRRVSHRLGLTSSKDPDEIEAQVGELLPPDQWTPLSMRLILHGRQICYARAPRCDQCPIVKECPKIGVFPARPAGPARRRSQRI
ncbi:MAG: endonuclease III [Deltaproteobacteria bacterium]|jgi:endonuclease III|nr:endonuclease III [Deltaproteobacteria bacterium]